ncbi:MAG TPA: SDR family oxidoreductase [Caulobacteraceae bacterium]|jgi:nucleoside-diphosphate-sugar epimerase
MRVFLTGATGFIGGAIVPELIAAGHQVLGLTRSDAGAQALIAAGAEPHRGELEDLDSLRSGAAQSDGVIHCAFIHDFSKFVENAEIDERAIGALGAALAGTDRPLIVSGGIGPWGQGGPVSEDDDHPSEAGTPRVSEPAALAMLSQGVSAAVVRLPQVHDTTKFGLVSPLIEMAREKGVSAYIDGGQGRWPAAHVRDVARLYRLALEQHKAGGVYHAVGEAGVSLKAIAEAIGRGLKLPVVAIPPEEAGAQFGFFGMFASLDLTASSDLTQQRLGWRPTGPGMIADLDGKDWS